MEEKFVQVPGEIRSRFEIVRETGDHQSVAQLFGRRNADLPAIKARPAALFGGKKLVTRRVVGDADDDLAVVLKPPASRNSKGSRERNSWCRPKDR